MSTRSSLISQLNATVLSGGRRTTAAGVRTLITDTLNSLLVKDSDANVNGGYMAISSTGYANASFVKSVTPTGLFLRDDGTWAAAGGGGGGENLSATLAIGNRTGNQPIRGDDDLSTFFIATGGVMEWTSDGGGYGEGWIFGDTGGVFVGYNFENIYINATRVAMEHSLEARMYGGSGRSLVSTADAYIYNPIGGFFATEGVLSGTRYIQIQAALTTISHDTRINITSPIVTIGNGVTTFPVGVVNFNGNVASDGSFNTYNSNPDDYFRINDAAGIPKLYLGYSASGGTIQSYGNPLIINKLGNNVGIGDGITSPSAPLHVSSTVESQGSGNPIFTIESTTGGTRQRFDAQPGYANQVEFRTGGAVKSRWYASPSSELLMYSEVFNVRTLSNVLSLGSDASGVITIPNLGGLGTRMVVSDSAGVLSTQAIPATPTLADVLGVSNLTNEISINSNNGRSVLSAFNAYAQFNYTNGATVGNLSIDGSGTVIDWTNGVNSGRVKVESSQVTFSHNLLVNLDSSVVRFNGLTASTNVFMDASKNIVSSSSTSGAPTMFYASGQGIDSIVSVGSDVLNIGATNANVINYGNASTVHNFLGTAIYEMQVNSYVEDKLITLNYGGSAASGIGVGFEIEENSIITGYLKTNAARSGFSILPPALSFATDFVFTTATSAKTKTFQNTTGTIAEWGDKLSVFAPTTSSELAGVISDETGTAGNLVFSNAPTLTNPIVGTQTALDNSTKAASTAYVEAAVAASIIKLDNRQYIRNTFGGF